MSFIDRSAEERDRETKRKNASGRSR